MFLSEETYSDFEYINVDNGFLSFQELYGLALKNSTINIVIQNDMYFDELENFPDTFLIGSDPGGNLYLADFNGKSNIYYWDRQKIHNWDQVDTLDGDEGERLYKVDSSFSNFLCRIKNNILGSKEVVTGLASIDSNDT